MRGEDEKIFRQGQRRAAALSKSPAKAPTKTPDKARRASNKEPFVQIPLWWAAAAAKATRMPGFLVCVELLHCAWKARSMTFSFPSGRLIRNGGNRWTKRRVLRRLEGAGLIAIEWRRGKNPLVTLVLL